ncbi:TetR/AcrR family transcriptional regulator [Dactylosporangium sucinum]|uniref:TetR/AcrR family transcriptional regulator n=1 Tax=Dactylosporangium sucinum TaxID=1424081 RepID=UPI00167D614C|nr:TetR/AcrR family transcriptional regulator [Dactylosporangium sucinum]
MSDAGVRQRVDGRTLRAERTRSAIVDAHLALLEEGELKPTAERIAERAGVSLRALWTNFKDMERLFAAAGERLMERQVAEFRPVPPELPLPERITSYCEQRARLLELIAPAARAARIREPFSAQLRRNRAWYIATAREELETLFAPELAAAGEGRGRIMDALTVAVTSSGWSMWRDELHLDVPGATAVLRHVVSALLPAAPTA